MKISFNRKIRREPWGGGAHFLSSFNDNLVEQGNTVISSLDEDVDVIFMLDPRFEDGGYSINEILQFKHYHPNVKVIHRVNDTDIARGTNFLDKLFYSCWNTKVFDHIIFISKWLRDYHMRGYSQDNLKTKCSVITNGCNHEWFYPETDVHNHKLVKHYSSDKIRLVTHHWSDNYNKGFDLYEYIDVLLDNPEFASMFEFTFIGRYNKNCKQKNVKVIEPLYGLELGNELRKHDIYVTAARYEACGMHHIEGMSCGLPVVFHKDGGGVVEICEANGGVMFDSLEDFIPKITKMMLEFQVKRRRMINFEKLNMTKVNEQYMRIIK